MSKNAESVESNVAKAELGICIFSKKKSSVWVNKETGELKGYIISVYSVGLEKSISIFVNDVSATVEKFDSFINQSLVEFGEITIALNHPKSKYPYYISTNEIKTIGGI